MLGQGWKYQYVVAVVVGLLCISTVSTGSLTANDILKIARRHLNRPELIESLVGRGEFDGYILQDTFWEAKKLLQEAYPNFIGEDVILGSSLESRPLKGFFFGKDVTNTSKQHTKSIVLLDSAHHARESVGLEMILTILLQELTSLQFNHPEASVYDTTSIFFYPIVNPDGFAQINKPGYRDKRKNMRVTGQCTYPVTEGVDINRNYDIQFNKFPELTNDKCGDEFKGQYPFSEPETQAVRAIFEKFPSTRSALNFHAYGNIWIQPYNFNGKGEEDIDRLQPELSELYEHFKKQNVLPPHANVGNAIKTIEYSASGEASDWMSVVKGVFVWSPELGPDDERGAEAIGDNFNTSPDLQRRIVRDQLPTVTAFVHLHRPKVTVSNAIWSEESHEIVISLKNEGYGDLHNMTALTEVEEADLVRSWSLVLSNSQNTNRIERMSSNVSLVIKAFPASYPRLETRKIRIRLLSSGVPVGDFTLLGKSITATPMTSSELIPQTSAKEKERALFGLVFIVIFLVFGILILVKCLKGGKEYTFPEGETALPEINSELPEYSRTYHDQI